MTRWSGVFRGLLFAATLFAAMFSADSASAWCWRGGYGFGWRPFCGPRYSYSYSYGYSGCFAPGFLNYSCYSPYVYRCYPYSYNLGCYPYWGGWGWGGWGCLPSAYGPVYGPAGVAPFLGFASATPTQADRPAGRVIPTLARASDTAIVRSSNTAARMRAGKLVAIGDRHLASAVSDRAALPKALDAYKRAATVAADQPDTFLRQAIVLVAMEKQEAADAAIARAVAIDGRLGDDPAAAREAARRLPPDPVFGDRPAGGPTVLASRTAGLIGRIFRDGEAAGDAGANWIAKLWSDRFGGDVARLAAK